MYSQFVMHGQKNVKLSLMSFKQIQFAENWVVHMCSQVFVNLF